ncbi:MAG TPA: hypothetical protein PLO63_03265 [Syntrophales bacterium]|nr:hypothetical protein [Syntrophales bacterium]
MNQHEKVNGEGFPLKRLRYIITLISLLLALAHLIWPYLAIDVVTLVLLIIAILPWLAPLIKSFELPGGWKMEFQDLQKVSSRADTAGLLAAEPTKKEEIFSFQSIARQDHNLALAGLRIEIEKRLSLLSEVAGLKRNKVMGIGESLRALSKHDILTSEERSILSDMINMLNAAVHGATVDQRSADWAIDVGPRLLTSLDERIDEVRATNLPIE